ncbi:hypothetical protein [Chitinophaga sp.]|uniref:hypothetical protein n=1 Tax=Chitinophaga sp. TaxID=1869181 RepID=UPI002F95662B
MANSIFIHEDDFDQIELVPAENYSRFFIEIENMPEGKGKPFGFTNMIVRDNHSGVQELNISSTELKDYLTPICFNSFINVKTGYGSSYTTTVKSAMAFGFERLGMVVRSNDTIVTNLNLVSSFSFITKESCDQILTALHSLGQQFNLILVDWNVQIIVRLTDMQAVKDYLSEEYGFKI